MSPFRKLALLRNTETRMLCILWQQILPSSRSTVQTATFTGGRYIGRRKHANILGRFSDALQQEAYRAELDLVGQLIASGGQASFDQAELLRRSRERDVFKSVSMTSVWKTVFRFFLPALLFLLGSMLLMMLLKHLE